MELIQNLLLGLYASCRMIVTTKGVRCRFLDFSSGRLEFQRESRERAVRKLPDKIESIMSAKLIIDCKIPSFIATPNFTS